MNLHKRDKEATRIVQIIQKGYLSNDGIKVIWKTEGKTKECK